MSGSLSFLMLLAFPTILLLIAFFGYFIRGKKIYNSFFYFLFEIFSLVIMPLFFLLVVSGGPLDCCQSDTAFAPEHKLTIYIIVLLCVISYFYSAYKHSKKSPVLEVFYNSFLFIGIILNLFVARQVQIPLGFFGNTGPIILFIIQVAENQKRYIADNAANFINPRNLVEKWAYKLLSSKPIIQLPLLFILCLPVLTLTISILLLFGQKPDSVIRAFTETYHQGFSQLDYQCENVICGGHYLCSVAANGHKGVVKPVRYGERGGAKIICNRQLLIANAFEELIEQRFPRLHKAIRRRYNKVGNAIHKHYHVFNNKYVADVVYILMKPLELIFLATLYTFDAKPENRIAQQYLNKVDRNRIRLAADI